MTGSLLVFQTHGRDFLQGANPSALHSFRAWGKVVLVTPLQSPTWSKWLHVNIRALAPVQGSWEFRAGKCLLKSFQNRLCTKWERGGEHLFELIFDCRLDSIQFPRCLHEDKSLVIFNT